MYLTLRLNRQKCSVCFLDYCCFCISLCNQSFSMQVFLMFEQIMISGQLIIKRYISPKNYLNYYRFAFCQIPFHYRGTFLGSCVATIKEDIILRHYSNHVCHCALCNLSFATNNSGKIIGYSDIYQVSSRFFSGFCLLNCQFDDVQSFNVLPISIS